MRNILGKCHHMTLNDIYKRSMSVYAPLIPVISSCVVQLQCQCPKPQQWEQSQGELLFTSSLCSVGWWEATILLQTVCIGFSLPLNGRWKTSGTGDYSFLPSAPSAKLMRKQKLKGVILRCRPDRRKAGVWFWFGLDFSIWPVVGCGGSVRECRNGSCCLWIHVHLPANAGSFPGPPLWLPCQVQSLDHKTVEVALSYEVIFGWDWSVHSWCGVKWVKARFPKDWRLKIQRMVWNIIDFECCFIASCSRTCIVNSPQNTSTVGLRLWLWHNWHCGKKIKSHSTRVIHASALSATTICITTWVLIDDDIEGTIGPKGKLKSGPTPHTLHKNSFAHFWLSIQCKWQKHQSQPMATLWDHQNSTWGFFQLAHLNWLRPFLFAKWKLNCTLQQWQNVLQTSCESDKCCIFSGICTWSSINKSL